MSIRKSRSMPAFSGFLTKALQQNPAGFGRLADGRFARPPFGSEPQGRRRADATVSLECLNVTGENF